jgi:hypothetical protein
MWPSKAFSNPLPELANSLFFRKMASVDTCHLLISTFRTLTSSPCSLNNQNRFFTFSLFLIGFQRWREKLAANEDWHVETGNYMSTLAVFQRVVCWRTSKAYYKRFKEYYFLFLSPASHVDPIHSYHFQANLIWRNSPFKHERSSDRQSSDKVNFRSRFGHLTLLDDWTFWT